MNRSRHHVLAPTNSPGYTGSAAKPTDREHRSDSVGSSLLCCDSLRMETGMSENLVYLNGQYIPYDEARVPVEDRGLQFADGVYEVVRYYGGRPFRMAQHLGRLVKSAAGIELPLPPVDELRTAMDTLIARQGLRVVTVSDDRWARCYLKTTALLPNALARERARRLGADDAIFVRDGFAMEATASNVFVVFKDRLVTPPLTNYILAGITREAILEFAAAEGIETVEEPVSAHLIYQADEVFISGTNSELGPVVAVDGRTIGGGHAGPIFERVLAAFDAVARSAQVVGVRST
jgi:D-alanine transaminase